MKKLLTALCLALSLAGCAVFDGPHVKYGKRDYHSYTVNVVPLSDPQCAKVTDPEYTFVYPSSKTATVCTKDDTYLLDHALVCHVDGLCPHGRWQAYADAHNSCAKVGAWDGKNVCSGRFGMYKIPGRTVK